MGVLTVGVIDRLLNRPLPPNAFVASAREVRLGDPVDAQKARQWRQAWQRRAFDFYDRVGELSFAVDRQADAIGQVRIFPAEMDEDGKPVETNDPKAWDLIDQLEEKQAGGRSEMLRRLGGHITLAGESHLVGIDNNAPEPETNGRVITMPDADKQRFRKSSWEILSSEELINSGTEWQVSRDGIDRVNLPSSAFVLRIWNPALRHSMLAHSAVRSVLDRLEELVLLGDEVAAISKSRVSAGGLKLPSEAKFPQREGEDPDKDPFVEDLIRHMTAPIGDTRSGEAVIPLVIRAAAEDLKDIGTVELGRSHDERDVERRKEVIERLATGLDWPKELLLGIGDQNHWCTTPDTEILTEGGWKKYDQLVEGEAVLTLNQSTGMSEWQPLQKVNSWDVADEPMVRIRGRRHSSLTTLAHRWPMFSSRVGRVWKTSGDLLEAGRQGGPNRQQHQYLVLGAPHADLPTEPKYQDALVELVAWYFTEGDRGIRPGRNTPQVAINQSWAVNPDNCIRIERALTVLFGSESEHFDQGGRYASPESVARRAKAQSLKVENPRLTLWEIAREVGVSDAMVSKYLKYPAKLRDDVPRWRRRRVGRMNRYLLNSAAAEIVTEHAPARVVSLNFVRSLTAAQLELFIDIATRADGIYQAGGASALMQKDPRMCDAYELALILAGRSPFRNQMTGYGTSATGPRLRTLEVVRGATQTTFAPRGRNISEEVYTGRVWCPTTPNGTWLARHEGTVCFTGNSAWFIGDQAFKQHTEPKLQLICSSLTAGYLRPGLEAAGVEDASRFLVWYDAAAANVEPDRTDDATKGVQNGALSWKAWRDATGWTDADAPALEELEIRAALIGRSLPGRAEEIAPEPVKGPPDQEESERRAEEPVTAAATPKTKTMGRQLAALERQTRERLAVSADAAARRALEKAGARLRSKFAGNAKRLGLQDALRGVKNPHVASHLGPEKVHALGLEEDDLMEDAANEWAALAGSRIRAAQRRMGVIVMDDPESADDRGARETAVGLLAGGFLAFLKEALYSPTVDMPTVGEFDGLMAPRKLIAQSLTIAGGGGVPDRELAGLTGGRIATELLADAGVKVTGYIWVHGAPDRPFPAHEELDGVSFTNWEDDVLLVQPGDEWIGLTHYAPLDHPMCSCSEELILEEDEAIT